MAEPRSVKTPLSSAEKAMIARLATTLVRPTPAAIARRVGRSPETIRWYMLRNGLIATKPRSIQVPYVTARGQRADPYTPDHDARMLELRVGDMSCERIAATLTAEFGIPRKGYSIRHRLQLLEVEI